MCLNTIIYSYVYVYVMVYGPAVIAQTSVVLLWPVFFNGWIGYVQIGALIGTIEVYIAVIASFLGSIPGWIKNCVLINALTGIVTQTISKFSLQLACTVVCTFMYIPSCIYLYV